MLEQHQDLACRDAPPGVAAPMRLFIAQLKDGSFEGSAAALQVSSASFSTCCLLGFLWLKRLLRNLY